MEEGLLVVGFEPPGGEEPPAIGSEGAAPGEPPEGPWVEGWWAVAYEARVEGLVEVVGRRGRRPPLRPSLAAPFTGVVWAVVGRPLSGIVVGPLSCIVEGRPLVWVVAAPSVLRVLWVIFYVWSPLCGADPEALCVAAAGADFVCGGRKWESGR